MEIEEFVAAFADLFDDTDPSEITPDCEYQYLDEWSSLAALGVIAMAKTKYGKTVSGSEIRNCVTVNDLFNLIASKN